MKDRRKGLTALVLSVLFCPNLYLVVFILLGSPLEVMMFERKIGICTLKHYLIVYCDPIHSAGLEKGTLFQETLLDNLVQVV